VSFFNLDLGFLDQAPRLIFNTRQQLKHQNLTQANLIPTMETSSSPSSSQHYSRIIAQPLPFVFPWEEMPYEIRDKIFSEIHDEDSA